jgi:hypothetical protein
MLYLPNFFHVLHIFLNKLNRNSLHLMLFIPLITLLKLEGEVEQEGEQEGEGRGEKERVEEEEEMREVNVK